MKCAEHCGGTQNKPDMLDIPGRLKPFFQEYDLIELDVSTHANLVIARVLEYGSWEEVRWLFGVYGAERIRSFVRQFGERWLHPVSFNYWRKLLKIRRWRHTPFHVAKGVLWNP